MTTARRRLALPALALAAALVLTACGSAGSGPAEATHSAGHSTDGGSSTRDDDEADEANEADLAFLTGMAPHHEQAVEMSRLVLAAAPPAEVAALARQVEQAQAPEVEQIEAMLEALGEDPDAGHGHASHDGAMSEQELAALRSATGPEAARLYLEAMVEHHEGAVEASDAELADGRYGPARRLAQEIRTAQLAEITRMRAMLEDL